MTLDYCERHGAWYVLGRKCRGCENGEVELTALEAKVSRLRGELGLMLEYFERGTPYWYGTSPADRIRAVLKESA